MSKGKILKRFYLDDALEAGVDEAAVLGLVQGICDEAEKNFERNKPTTTKALIKQGRRKAKLSEEETRQLLRLLVKGWKN